MIWEVTEFPNGQPPRVNLAHDPKEVNELLRLRPEEGHYTINPIR